MIDRLTYVIRDLLLAGKGTVWCKECGVEIQADQLTHRKSTPFDYDRGISSKEFKGAKKELGLKGKMNLPGSGGNTVYCDHGHELFGAMHWIS